MAAISGQPGTKPSQLKKPASAPDADIDMDIIGPVSTDAADAEIIPQTEAEPPPETEGTWAQTAVDLLPAAGGLAGGIVGAGLGTVAAPGVGTALGGIAGATAGGAAGEGYKQWIETNLMGKEAADPDAALKQVGTAAATEGGSQALGLGIAKGAGKLLATKGGQAVAAKAAALAAKPAEFIKGTIQAARDTVIEPLTKLIANKSTTLTGEESGNAVKSLFSSSIQKKYGKFIQAYSDIDAVGKAMPMDTKAREVFANDLRMWAKGNLGGDNLRTTQKVIQDLRQVNNGMQLDDMIKSLNAEARAATQAGRTDQAATLMEIRNRAENFIENQTERLAKRISIGGATPQEIAGFNQIMQSKGIVQQDAQKYAKLLAKDYLNERTAVRGEYAKFRGFLEDVGEQTKINPTGRGPTQFLKALDDVPSEKLIEKMFDPKNAAALRTMQRETPEVFEQVAKAKVAQIEAKAKLASVEGVLDIRTFRNEVMKLPPSTRNILFSADDLKTMNLVVNNPRLARLNSMQKVTEGKIADIMGSIVEAGLIGTGNAVKSASKMGPGTRQVVGKGVLRAGEKLNEAFKEPQE